MALHWEKSIEAKESMLHSCLSVGRWAELLEVGEIGKASEQTHTSPLLEWVPSLLVSRVKVLLLS